MECYVLRWGAEQDLGFGALRCLLAGPQSSCTGGLRGGAGLRPNCPSSLSQGPRPWLNPRPPSASGASFQRPSDMGKTDTGKLSLKLASTVGPLGAME